MDSWHVDRNAVIPEEEEVVVYNSKQQGVEDVGTPDRASNSNTDNHGETDKTAMYPFYSTQGLSAPSIPSSPILPLHIPALHGVSHTIMEGLCCAYPKGTVTPMITPLHYD